LCCPLSPRVCRTANSGAAPGRALRRLPKILKDQTMILLTDPPAAEQETPRATGPTGSHPADRGWFQAFLPRIHFDAGILAGPFLLIAAVTGGLYAMTPQLEQSLYSRELHVPAVTQPLPLSAQVEAATDYAGGVAPVTVRPAPAASASSADGGSTAGWFGLAAGQIGLAAGVTALARTRPVKGN
jgi:hypothetical protein